MGTLAPSLATRSLEGSSQRTRAPPGKRQSAGRRFDDSLSRSSSPRARSKDERVPSSVRVSACVRAYLRVLRSATRGRSVVVGVTRIHAAREIARASKRRTTTKIDGGDGEVSALKLSILRRGVRASYHIRENTLRIFLFFLASFEASSSSRSSPRVAEFSKRSECNNVQSAVMTPTINNVSGTCKCIDCRSVETVRRNPAFSSNLIVRVLPGLYMRGQ